PPSPLLSMPIFLTAFHRSSNFQERRSQGARRGGESADPQIVDAELLHAIALVPLLGGGIGAGHRELQLVRAFPERHLAELLLQKVVRRRVEVKLAGDLAPVHRDPHDAVVLRAALLQGGRPDLDRATKCPGGFVAGGRQRRGGGPTRRPGGAARGGGPPAWSARGPGPGGAALRRRRARYLSRPGSAALLAGTAVRWTRGRRSRAP